MIALLSAVSVPSLLAQGSDSTSILLPLVIDGQAVDFIPQSDLVPLKPEAYDAASELEPVIESNELQAATSGYSSNYSGTWFSNYSGRWYGRTYNYSGYTYRSSYINCKNNSSHEVKVYWRDSSASETLYKTLQPGESYWQHSYSSHEWVMRDEHGHMLAEATASYQSQAISVSDADYGEAHADDDDKSDDKECDCEKGVTEMTLKLVKRHDRADKSERIRVRQGGLGGAVLFDSNDDGNSNPGLDLGDKRTFTINNPGEDIVVTVYGKYHRNETVKARFETDCSAEVGEKDGNRYIKFKITDLKTDSDANECKEPEPEPEPEGDRQRPMAGRADR